MASVARQPAAATSMMARVDRLDLVLSYLEELHHNHHHHHGGSNLSTSSPSTPTTQSGDSSPRGSASWRRACRPAKEVLEEAHAKGSLVDRIAFLEDRVLKMEEDMEITPEGESSKSDQRKEKVRDGNKKKGLKSLVKSCVRGKLKTKD
ncbi:hypothetical protein PR202_ga11717 [Eleusine coracana subsp. coracana]|uniref:Uncharacterized protein n=1 Tax=Eleusine coracana subsp. coracana TaxID=191504 RepID=A0AAV5C9R0_ELECO|nr:hypothetical protein PR202_ga11717 [Eleusine coracana subsp. coracana]